MSTTTVASMTEVTPRMAAELIEDCFYAGMVPYLRGSPGIGKSSIFHQVFHRLGLYMIDHRASTSDPTDFNGLPGFEDGKAKFMPFEEIFPIQSTPVPEGYDGFGIFLDEINTAPKSVLAASYKLALDKKVGQKPLHERAVVAMAGNLDTDGAITNRIGTALQSRLITFRLRTDFTEFQQDVMTPQLWDERVVAYLNANRTKLSNFSPDHTEDTFACPRTWDFLQRLIKGKDVEDRKLPLYAGTIGQGMALDFLQFTKVYTQVPTIEAVCNDPLGFPVPNDRGLSWAIIMRMANQVDKTSLVPVLEFIGRFPFELRIQFLRTVAVRDPSLQGHSKFIDALADITKYTQGTQNQITKQDPQLGGFALAA